MRSKKPVAVPARRAARAPQRRRRISAAPAGASALVLAFALLPSGLARAQSPLEPHMQITANAMTREVTVEMRDVPRAACQLRVSDESWTTLMAARLGASGERSWRIDARPGLAKAAWTFYAICRLGHRYGWHMTIAQMGFPEPGGALVAGVAAGSAPSTSCDEQGLCFAEDPLEPGQCGWYALGRRPELLPYVEHSPSAGEWLADAAAALPEGATPQVGALAVWSIASDPPHGHVAYVAAVSGGDILVDDSNWRPTASSPGLQLHEHWVPASQPAGYIYAS